MAASAGRPGGGHPTPPRRTAAKPTAAKPTAAKPTAAKPTAATRRSTAAPTRTTADRTAANRTAANRTAADRTAADRTAANRTAANRTGGRPAPGRSPRPAPPRRSTRAAARGARRPAPPRRPPRRRTLLRLGDPGRRLGVGFAAVCTLLVVLGGRLVQLQGFDADHLAERAEQNRLVPTTIPAVRGQILDRDGRPLAYTVAARTIFADPTKIKDAVGTARQLAPLLRQTAAALLPKLRKPKTRYVPLVKDLSPAEAARVLAAGLTGIGAEDTTQRLYPGGDLASAVVGYTNADGGLGGIESKFNTALAGTPGKLEVERGSNGLQIPGGVRAETAAVPGSTVQLTLDEDLQFTAQRALAAAVRKARAQSGQIVVLDAKTAEVLAMATAPAYDAQNPSASKPDQRANPAVQAPVEPGSANKVVTFAAALDRGRLRPDTPMLVPDGYQVPGKIIHDAWSHAPTRWTATGVLAKSSNVGTLMIATDLVGGQAFYDYERRFGIGEKSGIELPGESAGILPPPQEWSGTTFGNLPIGQGLSMTPLQLAGMYQAIANDGVRITPRIVKAVVAPDGTVTNTPAPTRTTVVSTQAARTARTMLEAVVGEGGTAPAAAIDAYRVAGKTGTAQKPNPECRCYSGGGYWATFAGLAPADRPELVISVVIDQGKRGGHGGVVAGPLFKEVMSYGLTARKVAPTGTPRPTQKLTVD